MKAGVAMMLDKSSIAASTIAEAIGFAISQPPGVDIIEIVVRPTANA